MVFLPVRWELNVSVHDKWLFSTVDYFADVNMLLALEQADNRLEERILLSAVIEEDENWLQADSREGPQQLVWAGGAYWEMV